MQPRQNRGVAGWVADLDGVMFRAAILGAQDMQARPFRRGQRQPRRGGRGLGGLCR